MSNEHETIILINDSDRSEGYFQIGTSKESVYTRVLKRIGGKENLVGLKLSEVRGRVVWYQMRIPVRLLSRTMSIKGRKSTPGRAFTGTKTKTHSLPLTKDQSC